MCCRIQRSFVHPCGVGFINIKDQRSIMNKIIFILLPLFLFGGTVGKISGTVKDAETNEPLVGVDVFIPDLGIGGATDENGYYFILNVPPGTYEVEASMIGYRAEIKQQVQVYTDRTTLLNFELQTTVIEMENPVVVVAERPIIEVDMTSKEARITRSEMDILPVEKPLEVIVLQGGVTTDGAGELHIRGGRSGELAYYIDGIEVSNPLLGSSPIFNKNIISEMSLLSGTFNAEYGNVMSGVVNIVTPEGGERISTYLEYTSFMLNPSPYRKKDWMNSLDSTAYDAHRDSSDISEYNPQYLDAPFLGEINAAVMGPIPFDRRLKFSFSGNYSNEESYLPFGYESSYSLNGKLTRKFGGNLKLFIDGQYVNEETQNYSHRYKYIYENYLVTTRKNLRAIVGINHAPAGSFFYNLRVGYLVDSVETAVPDLSDDTIIEPVYDNYSEFYVSGYPIYRQFATTKQYVVKMDFTLHFARVHNLKWGIEHNHHDFFLDKREQLFTRGAVVYQNYQRTPMDGAVFLQDKIEHRSLVANLGLRFDYCFPKTVMWEDIEDPTSPSTEVEPKYQLSPRFGLSHPITDNAMLHFAYGYFFQMPPYEIMYFNGDYIVHPESIPRYGLVGNPRIEPQRTTAYEVGIKYAIQQIYGVDITLFLKDIKNLLATTEVRSFPYDYIIYTNDDFGSVQGIDVTINRKVVSHFGFSFNYTYQVARGNHSFAMQGFYDVYTGMPERLKEYFLDFDRRHTLSSNLKILFGQGGGLSFNVTAASGLPYTPYISEGVVVEQNSARMGWEYSFDAIAYQGFKICGTVLEFFVKGTNLTDHKNPLYVYPRSGEPWDSGESEGGLMGSKDYIMNPSYVGPRRAVKAGMRIKLQ